MGTWNALYYKVDNTGRATAVVRSGHPIAKVIALNVRDDDRFRALFGHPMPTDPTPEPSIEITPAQGGQRTGATTERKLQTPTSASSMEDRSSGSNMWSGLIIW